MRGSAGERSPGKSVLTKRVSRFKIARIHSGDMYGLAVVFADKHSRGSPKSEHCLVASFAIAF